MTIHKKTDWKDHIMDSGGQVVQQGTPLSAGNLNRMEEGLANATAFTTDELAAATAHSGVLQLVADSTRTASTQLPGQVYINTGTDWLNSFGLKAFTALIAGIGITVGTSNNRITLPAPPTEGARDDLVFLEAWREQVTQAWKTRFRVVAGVDFIAYTDGLQQSVLPNGGGVPNYLVQAQGGNAAAVNYNETWTSGAGIVRFGTFSGPDYRGGSSVIGKNVAVGDWGLYLAGDGTEASKAALKTYDGYVYAIPLFKVNRRNSGGYSANNPNGARDYYSPGASLSVAIAPGQTGQLTVSSEIYAKCRVGDKFDQTGQTLGLYTAQIISKDGGTTITVKNVGANAVQTLATYQLRSDRPDNLFANTIAERDITDLRHKTYLVAPSYEQLLIEGTDQILRGASQVERKAAMRKTYVGVRKTPLDANHIFYASMDGTVTAEVGTLSTVTMGQNGSGFAPMPTGSGYKTPSAVAGQFTELVPTSGLGNTFTIEFFVDVSQSPASSGQARTLADIKDANNLSLFRLLYNPTSFDTVMLQTATVSGAFGTTYTINTPAANKASKKAHIRLTYNNGMCNLYMDGTLLYTLAFTLIRAAAKVGLTRTWVGLEGTVGNETYSGGTMIYSDVAISKIDRGATFATLPADFISGYADITPSLSDQRRINSDAQTSQKTFASAKVKNLTQEPGITVMKGTDTNNAAWEVGDKIKVRGLAGEIISGVIDTDTALAKVTALTDTTHLVVDDVSKLAVNDTITVVYTGGISGAKTVTAIDPTTKTLTITPSTDIAVIGGTLYETTANTSSPVVRAIIAGTSTNIPGTWTALGTNEAELTLGSLPSGLVAQDIIIEYSLNMPVGQGSLYQVYSKILGGEINGKPLVVSLLAAMDDMVGKITGSTTVTPHKAYSATNGTTATPVAPGTEFTQADYDAVKVQDNALKTVTTSVIGQAPAVVISIDILRTIESKYGKVPGYTTAEKVTWLKANLSRIRSYVYAYGAGPAGTKATLGYRLNNNWSVNTSGAVNNTATIQSLMATTTAVAIDENGVYHVIVYGEPADGVTPSTLFLDYWYVDMTFVDKAGYDLLVPENSRRDAGLGGALYVRKTTREVESLFPGNDEDNGISIIGDYVPTQEMLITPSPTSLTGAVDVLLNQQGFVTTAGTNRPYGTGNNYANAIANLLGPSTDLNYKVDPQSLVSTQAFEGAYSSGVLRYWYVDTPYGTGLAAAGYTDGIPAWAKSVAEFLGGYPALVQYNGELLLRISFRPRSTLGNVGIGGTTSIVWYYRLPGRPLVKL